MADPKHPRLGYFVNPATPPKAEDWLAAAQRHEGSWWEHWVGWLAERSGGHSEAPEALGSISFPPKEPALAPTSSCDPPGYDLEAPAVPAGWTSAHATRARKPRIAAVAHTRTMARSSSAPP